MEKSYYEESVLLPIIRRLINYLEVDMGIKVNTQNEIVYKDHVSLKSNTAMIGTGGDIRIILTLGYDEGLLEELVDRFLYGEKVEDDELIEVQESVCCEIANIVIGNAIKNPYNDSLISITPPILIHEAKSFAKYKNSTIVEVVIATQFGEIQLSAVGPKELFSDKLNFKEL
mgnify:CR=1 FL=1